MNISVTLKKILRYDTRRIIMELKVGEIFEFEGATLQAVETEDMTCIKCYFNYLKNCDFHCLPSERFDKKNVMFIKV